MVRLALRLLNESLVRDYSVSFNEKMNGPNSRLLDGRSYVLPDKEFVYLFIELDLLAPPIHFYLSLISLVALVLTGFNVFTIILLLLTGLVWSVQLPFLYRLLVKKGLRKKGYVGEVVFF